MKLAQGKACFAADLPGITTKLESFLFSVCTGNQVIDESLTFQGPDRRKLLVVGLQMMMQDRTKKKRTRPESKSNSSISVMNYLRFWITGIDKPQKSHGITVRFSQRNLKKGFVNISRYRHSMNSEQQIDLKLISLGLRSNLEQVVE